MAEIRVAIVEGTPIALGEKQIVILNALRRDSSLWITMDSTSIKRLKKRNLIGDEGQINSWATQALNLIESKEYETYDNWGEANKFISKFNKENRKGRESSPCGCDCAGCLRNCTAHPLDEEEEEELPELEI